MANTDDHVSGDKICSRIIHVQRQQLNTGNVEPPKNAVSGRAALLRGLSVDAGVRAASVIVKSPRLIQVR